VSISQEIELTDGSIGVSSAILKTPEEDECWSKHIVLCRRDFKGFKKQVACDTING
jgi:hypothetical protein